MGGVGLRKQKQNLDAAFFQKGFFNIKRVALTNRILVCISQ
jgi:hypothetical protein